jgi:hypothetical protein
LGVIPGKRAWAKLRKSSLRSKSAIRQIRSLAMSPQDLSDWRGSQASIAAGE